MSAQCLHELFRTAAEKWPERIAVSDEGTAISYRELDRRSSQLAHRLTKLGAGPEGLVGLCLERNVNLIIGLLAILKTGAGYLPLDPNYPAERLRFMLTDSGCTIVIGPAMAGVESVMPDDDSLATEPDVPPTTATRRQNLAYVIYTSGSTGQPKGVAVTHANVVRLFSSTQKEFDFSEHDVWTMFHSVAFDFSVWEMWGALSNGGRLLVVPYGVSRDPGAFLDLLIRERVTMLSQTPSAFRQLLHATEEAGFPDTDLRAIVFGGERLDPSMLRTWIERYGDTRPRLVNMYGITETTVHTTIRRMGRADLGGTSSPIGSPLSDVFLYILDQDHNKVQPGRTGEIYVGGAGVSRGYVNRPQLTAERFLTDPFGPPGGRMYRTGDLGEIDERGDVVFHGRIDRQLQLRGFRIEPAEVESVIARHPKVREAVVTTQEDHRLACYWVPESGTDISEAVAEIRALTGDRLPAHMIPAVFTALSQLPLTENGKLDYEALPKPTPSDGRPTAHAPDSSMEMRLAEIWRNILEADSIHPEDSFFGLGGDSILAIKMVAEAKASRIDISIRTLFDHPIFGDLLRILREAN